MSAYQLPKGGAGIDGIARLEPAFRIVCLNQGNASAEKLELQMVRYEPLAHYLSLVQNPLKTPLRICLSRCVSNHAAILTFECCSPLLENPTLYRWRSA
jgi:hypothetical protein